MGYRTTYNNPRNHYLTKPPCHIASKPYIKPGKNLNKPITYPDKAILLYEKPSERSVITYRDKRYSMGYDLYRQTFQTYLVSDRNTQFKCTNQIHNRRFVDFNYKP